MEVGGQKDKSVTTALLEKNNIKNTGRNKNSIQKLQHTHSTEKRRVKGKTIDTTFIS